MPEKPKTFRHGSVGRTLQRKSNYDNEWRKLRRRVLDGEPLCRPCCHNGHVTPATQVDHITPLALGGTHNPLNLQPICDDCHTAKTILDNRRIKSGR